LFANDDENNYNIIYSLQNGFFGITCKNCFRQTKLASRCHQTVFKDVHWKAWTLGGWNQWYPSQESHNKIRHRLNVQKRLSICSSARPQTLSCHHCGLQIVPTSVDYKIWSVLQLLHFALNLNFKLPPRHCGNVLKVWWKILYKFI